VRENAYTRGLNAKLSNCVVSKNTQNGVHIELVHSDPVKQGKCPALKRCMLIKGWWYWSYISHKNMDIVKIKENRT